MRSAGKKQERGAEERREEKRVSRGGGKSNAWRAARTSRGEERRLR